MSNITVLIPTSPIPSHPDTGILDETIFNTRRYTNALIVIMFDGVHESLAHRTEDYEKYKATVMDGIDSGKYGDCIGRVFSHHTHQAEMTRIVLKEIVKTPLILFNEHDTSIIGDVPFKKLCRFVEHNDCDLNYLRFNIFHEVLKEHQYLMIDKEPVILEGVRLVRTLQYSQRPHIAKSNWYRSFLFDYFETGSKVMIEDVLHGVVISKEKEIGFDTFGLAIYTPEGNQLRSYHSDGRKTDEKIVEG